MPTERQTQNLLRSSSRENRHHNMCARRIVNPQASLIVKEMTHFFRKKSKQNKKGETVQGADFAVDLTDSKFTSGGMFCKIGGDTLGPISWVCKKHTTVSHGSKEAEVISLNTGPRIEGLPALKLLDTVINVFEPLANRASGHPSRQPATETGIQ